MECTSGVGHRPAPFSCKELLWAVGSPASLPLSGRRSKLQASALEQRSSRQPAPVAGTAAALAAAVALVSAPAAPVPAPGGAALVQLAAAGEPPPWLDHRDGSAVLLYRSPACAHRGAPPRTARERLQWDGHPDMPRPPTRPLLSSDGRPATRGRVAAHHFCCEAAALRHKLAAAGGPLEGEATAAWIRTLRSYTSDLSSCMCYACFMQMWDDVGNEGVEEMRFGCLRPEAATLAPCELLGEENMPSLKRRARHLADARRGQVTGPDAARGATRDLMRALLDQLPSLPLASTLKAEVGMLELCASKHRRPVSAPSAPPRGTARAAARPGTAGARPGGTGRKWQHRQDELRDAHRAEGQKRAADILTAMHERHVLLEAQMRLSRQKALLEEEEVASVARAPGGRRSSRRRSTEERDSVGAGGFAVSVQIIGASNLTPLVPGGSADAMCCIVLAPSSRHITMQTQPVYGSLNPRWDEQFKLVNYREGETICFEVYDQLEDQVLGKANLQHEAFANEPFEGNLPLARPQTRSSAFPEIVGQLSVRVCAL